jgi:hypothetical protein
MHTTYMYIEILISKGPRRRKPDRVANGWEDGNYTSRVRMSSSKEANSSTVEDPLRL